MGSGIKTTSSEDRRRPYRTVRNDRYPRVVAAGGNAMTVRQALGTSLRQELEPLITREISGIATIDTAIAHTSAPDYVVMFQSAKNGKQANVEQMATLVRMHGNSPDETGGMRKTLTR